MFYWFEPVLYLDPNTPYPETVELPGFFVGFADNVGDAMTFKILTNNQTKVIHRSVVYSAMDPSTRNKRVSFGPITDHDIDKLDTSRLYAKPVKPPLSPEPPPIATRTRTKQPLDTNPIASRTREHLQMVIQDTHKLYKTIGKTDKEQHSSVLDY